MYREGVSVIICCYNSSSRLPKTLKHLASQQVNGNINWEVIVVDNGSTDDTAAVAKQEWGKYITYVPFKVVDQPIPGQAAARDKGYEVSTYEYLMYVDDDNWLAPDYVNLAFEIMQQNPQIGILGGQCKASFEIEPPSWFFKKSSVYAVGKQAENTGPLTDTKGYLYGAASVIRKSAWAYLRDNKFKFLTVGRSGTQLSGGDDVELNKAIRLAGYTLWYDERLHFIHFMSASRLTWDYFLKIGKGSSASSLPLHIYDYFLQERRLSYPSFIFLYSKEILRRTIKIALQPISFIRYCVSRPKEGNITAFDFMRSFIFLVQMVRSFNAAKGYFYQIKQFEPLFTKRSSQN